MKILLAIALLLSGASSGLAADPVISQPAMEPPAYQPPPLWTGVYIGGQIGWAHGQKPPHIPVTTPPDNPPQDECDLGDFAWAFASTSNTNAAAWADPCTAWGLANTGNTGAGAGANARSDDFNINNIEEPSQISYHSGGHRDVFIGGVHIGYNRQFDNNLVLGAVADYNFLSWDRYIGSSFQEDNDNEHSFNTRQSLDYLGTVRAKIGYAAGRALIYGTAGLAYGGIKNELSIDEETIESVKKTRFGYAVGAGADFLISDNVSIGAEYLFIDLGKKSNNEFFRDNVRFHSIFLKASYYFK